MLGLIHPPLWRTISQFGQARIETDYFNETYISDAYGMVLERVQPEVEGYALSNVTLPDFPPQPKGRQPPFGISKFTYLFDTIADMMLASEYKRKTHQYLDHKTAPSKPTDDSKKLHG